MVQLGLSFHVTIPSWPTQMELAAFGMEQMHSVGSPSEPQCYPFAISQENVRLHGASCFLCM